MQLAGRFVQPTPDLLQPLDDTSTSDPDLSQSSGFFAEVETEEEEAGSGGHGIT